MRFTSIGICNKQQKNVQEADEKTEGSDDPMKSKREIVMQIENFFRIDSSAFCAISYCASFVFQVPRQERETSDNVEGLFLYRLLTTLIV